MEEDCDYGPDLRQIYLEALDENRKKLAQESGVEQ